MSSTGLGFGSNQGAINFGRCSEGAERFNTERFIKGNGGEIGGDDAVALANVKCYHPLEPILRKVTGLKEIELIFQKFPFLRNGYVKGLRTLFKILPPLTSSSSTKIMNEDWDVLIVLDACRFDYFERYNDIDGKLEKRISPGSHTKEWMIKNFTAHYHDTVYVSATPQVSKILLKKRLGFIPFLSIDEVWDYGWDEKLNTVPPEKVTDAALRTRKKFPNKRMIIHYMQPHHPFVLAPRLVEGGLRRLRSQVKSEVIPGVKKIWDLAKEGKVDLDQIKNGYASNLKLVLKEAKKLVRELDGKIIVTSDHGNCFGEYWLYEHPHGIHVKPLIEIPWLIIEKQLFEDGTGGEK